MIKEYISYPKINICFKILGFKDNGYCDIISRYVRVKDSYFDVINISDSRYFDISGNIDCNLFNNTIYRAKEALKIELQNNSKSIYLEKYHIKINKQIPICAGLGGGSSNAAIYLIAMNEILELGFGKEQLICIATRVGADVGFFVCDIDSANVRGIGDVICAFDEVVPPIEIFTPPIHCSTIDVYNRFKINADFSDKKCAEDMIKLDSATLLQSYDFIILNDLYKSALSLYPNLSQYARDGYFFSGSGSSFFTMK